MELDIRKAKLAAKVKWALVAAGALLISPVIFMIVKGLVGLAIAGVVGLAIVQFAPVVSMKFANWKLSALKGEARGNPIETRQNQSIERRTRLSQVHDEIANFAAEVANFTTEVQGLKRTQPEDAAVFEHQLDQLKMLLQKRMAAHQNAIEELQRFDDATARAARKWKVAQSALRMQKLAGSAQSDAMDKILAEEALDSVETALNRAFADMDLALSMEPPALTHQPADVIDVQAVVKVKQEIAR
jgi:hypothetical protein